MDSRWLVCKASTYYRQAITELDSAGYQGTDILPNVVSFLTSALNELGEIAAMDSVVAASIKSMAAVHGQHASGQLNFLRGLAKLRLGELDSADVWIVRAMRDTTEARVVSPRTFRRRSRSCGSSRGVFPRRGRVSPHCRPARWFAASIECGSRRGFGMPKATSRAV